MIFAMEVYFKNKRLAGRFEEDQLTAAWDELTARKIAQRMNELLAAPTLADLSHLPPIKCHELKGKKKGQFSVYAGQKVRIVFQPYGDETPRKPDDGIDRSRVTAIMITVSCQHE
jgi:proteic killer suppression protein